jgi:L-threonylcarbamoyladenylate synthase
MALTLSVNPDEPVDRPLLLAAEVVRAGGVVVYPTETLYGIGANAWDVDAIRRVETLKGRTEAKPVLVLINSRERLSSLIASTTPVGEKLMEAFWPGPLTLVFASSKQVPSILSKGTGTIGVRIPSSPLCLRFLALCDAPLTSTSANRSGFPSLRSVKDIRREFPTGVDLFLDGGELPQRPPSTVVDVTGDIPLVLRLGAVTLEQLREIVPDIRTQE